jgi:Zn-dependent peptidase ImmA (M78 family)
VVYRAFDGDEDISGFYLRDKQERIIGVNNSQAVVRQRFTIAHELGHALLEEKDGVHVDGRFNFRDTRSSLAIDPDEMAANQFAAELLMPESEVFELVGEGIDVTDDGELRTLARRFGVSQQAMAYRLVNLGLGIDGKARF